LTNTDDAVLVMLLIIAEKVEALHRPIALREESAPLRPQRLALSVECVNVVVAT